jgi:hypothetical protein
MKLPQMYKCDGCGITSDSIHDWFGTSDSGPDLAMISVHVRIDQVVRSSLHYCGSACAIKAISEFLSKSK